MATILVDFENVSTTDGLKGIEYLNENDTLIIFDSQCCEKIWVEYIQMIEKSQCEFRTYKLARTGLIHEFGRVDGRAIYQVLKQVV